MMDAAWEIDFLASAFHRQNMSWVQTEIFHTESEGLFSMNGFQLTEEGKTHADCERDLNENCSALFFFFFLERSI